MEQPTGAIKTQLSARPISSRSSQTIRCTRPWPHPGQYGCGLLSPSRDLPNIFFIASLGNFPINKCAARCNGPFFVLHKHMVDDLKDIALLGNTAAGPSMEMDAARIGQSKAHILDHLPQVHFNNQKFTCFSSDIVESLVGKRPDCYGPDKTHFEALRPCTGNHCLADARRGAKGDNDKVSVVAIQGFEHELIFLHGLIFEPEFPIPV